MTQNSNTYLSFDNNQIHKLKQVNNTIGLHDTNIKNIVFVYTPPKVGSTTLVSSIRLSAAYKFRVVHVHDEDMLNVLTGITDVTINDIIKYNKFIGRNVYVIDVYREPLERKMSEFFDKLCTFHFNNTAEKVNRYNVERLISRFNNIFTHIATGDHYFDKYTDVIKPNAFDFEKKYLLQKVFDISYIKLRLRDSALWGKILTSILGAEITIIKDYEMDKSPLGELYKRFKTAYKIPSNYVTYIENETYFKYYLSVDEQRVYLSNLKTKQTDPCMGYTPAEYNVYINICIENQWNLGIDTNHYLDEGCTCRDCSKQRRIIVAKARRGEPPKEKLTHSLAVKLSAIDVDANKIQHPHLPTGGTSKRARLQKKTGVLKHSLTDNILEARVNRW